MGSAIIKAPDRTPILSSKNMMQVTKIMVNNTRDRRLTVIPRATSTPSIIRAIDKMNSSVMKIFRGKRRSFSGKVAIMLIKRVLMETILSVNSKEIWRICNGDGKLKISRSSSGRIGLETSTIAKAIASTPSTRIKSIKKR